MTKQADGHPIAAMHYQRDDELGTLCGLDYGTSIPAGDVVIDDREEIGDITCEACREKLLDDITVRALEAMPERIELVYVDYRDQLSDKQVAEIVKGDWDYTIFDQWLPDAEWDGLMYVLGESLDSEAERDLLRGSEGHWDRFQEQAYERNRSNPVRDLARNTPAVLLRIPIDAIDEDHAYGYEEVDADEVLGRLGLEKSEPNRKAVQYALDNASPEFSTLMGYWIVGADPTDLLDLPENGKVEITNPYLYLGNPFSGSGFITEDALVGTVTVDRKDLRTDKDAFGYSVDEVYGGLPASQFEATIRPVTEPAAGEILTP